MVHSSVNGTNGIEVEAPFNSSDNSDGSAAPLFNGDAESTPTHQTVISTTSLAERAMCSVTGK